MKNATDFGTMTSADLRDAKKALAALKGLYKAENRDVYGRAHAAKGGEFGVDGNWYEAGEFLPDNEYREFQMKIKGAGKSVDPEAPRASLRGEVSIWEVLRLKVGMTEPRLIKDSNVKNQAAIEAFGGWYSIDRLTAEDAVSYYIEATKRACDRGCTPYEPTAEIAAENISKLLSRYNEVYAEMHKSAEAVNAVALHLFNLRRNGVFFVSELYVLALRKAAAEKYGITLEVKMPWKFSFRRNGIRKNSIWFYLNADTTAERACDFWRNKHPLTTDVKGHHAVEVVRAKGDWYLAFEEMPRFVSDKLPTVEL